MEWMLTYFDPANPYCRAGAIFTLVSFLLIEISINLIIRYFSRKSNYNCEECRNWACQWKECDRKWLDQISKVEKEN